MSSHTLQSIKTLHITHINLHIFALTHIHICTSHGTWTHYPTHKPAHHIHAHTHASYCTHNYILCTYNPYTSHHTHMCIASRINIYTSYTCITFSVSRSTSLNLSLCTQCKSYCFHTVIYSCLHHFAQTCTYLHVRSHKHPHGYASN